MQQGQRYSRQIIGHYSNSSNRRTALYIDRCTVCTVVLTVSEKGEKLGLLCVQQGQSVGLTVSSKGTEGGAYCECNRDREWDLF